MSGRFPLGPEVYARIREVRISERDREAAITAMKQADMFVDALCWIKRQFESFGRSFLKFGRLLLKPSASRIK